MKLFLLILVFSLQVSAAAYSQNISLSFKNAPLFKVLQSVTEQSGYSFTLPETVKPTNNPITITLKNAPIEKTLLTIFNNQPYIYKVEGKLVMVAPKTLPTVGDKKAELTEQQRQDLKGYVTDSIGRPLAGATVSIEGQKGKGAVVDANGMFIIRNAPENGQLKISLIGYDPQTASFSGNTVSVILKQSTANLEVVRVIAYSTTNRKLTTGNIGGIKAEDIEKQPVTNPMLALQGRIPGVYITQNSGYAGAGVTVRIQGQNSIRYGNDPFYVVDGVPFTSQVLPNRSTIQGNSGTTAGQEAGSGSPFSYLNPSDIESIDVLKDADATAIYGSRAANGAILITTKKGKAGKTRLDVTLQNGVGQLGRKMKLLNTQQYLEMRKEAYTNDGIPIPTPASPKDFSNFDLTVFDQNSYTDWQKELLGGNAHYSDAQVALSGGSAHTTFRLNAGIHRETTIFPADFSDKKVSFGVNIDHSSDNNKFRLQFSSVFQNDDNRLPSTENTSAFLQLSPNAPALRKADGSINWNLIESNPMTQDSVSTWINPLSYFESKVQIKTSNLISNLNLSYVLAKGLTLKTSLGYTDMISSDIVVYPLTSYQPEYRPFYSRAGQYSDSRGKTWIVEPQLTYGFSLNKGQGSFLIGTTFQETQNVSKPLNGYGFNSDEVIADYHSASTLLTGFNTVNSIYKYTAVFARLNYNWDNKYIINLTARRDGSSRFGKENRFENFGAIGAAWLFSNEDFVRDHIGFLSFGKIRGSYGTTGSDQIGNYSYLNLYNNITPPQPYQTYAGLTPAGLPNPYLQWELTKKLQGAIDLGFINDRILIGVNYFRNRSSNQLLPYALPYQVGFSEILQNFPAKVQNQGWEFTVSTENIKRKKFSWSSNFNLTANRNKLLEFPNLETSSYSNGLIIGQPLIILKLYNYAGVDPQTGEYQFLGTDGKTTISPDPQKDNYVNLSIFPRYYGGFQNTFKYKDFSLDFLLQFTKQLERNFTSGFGFIVGSNSNQPVEVLDRWRKPGDQAEIQKFSTTNFRN